MTMSPDERRRRMRDALNRSSLRRNKGAANEDEISFDFSRKDETVDENAENNETDQQEPQLINIKEAETEREEMLKAEASEAAAENDKNTEEKHENPQKSQDGRKKAALKKAADSRADRRVFAGALGILILAVLVLCAKGMFGSGQNDPGNGTAQNESPDAAAAESESAAKELSIMEQAQLKYAQYDYDGSVDLLKTLTDYDSNTEAQELAAKCVETKATLVEQDINEITHVFFHILCVDPENSFDKSKWGKQADGYNSLMTTIDEFKKMIQEMYDKGYVLVSIRDMAHPVENADGSISMEKGSIMLPPGKKAFVMSEDDVCYYEYMEGAGYADKMIVGDDGRPTLHYTDADGKEHVGDYDLVGVLDSFIDEHPDFSYKGHKACLVFTGYNGILGYRTDESYDPNSEYYDDTLEKGHDVEAERREAVKVLKALVADGYDVGSHSWGHRDLGNISMDRFKKDCDRWNRNVASLIKEATGEQPDIIIYPRGADIADWHGYDHSNERFDYLFNLGFRYYCNVDSSEYWVQLGSDYLRQGRRALDGYNMWNDIGKGYNRLGDLFDNVSEIFDPARPTPVPGY